MPADRELSKIYARLGTLDAVLADLVRRHGRPDPFVWSPAYDAARTTFASLVLHVISQRSITPIRPRTYTGRGTCPGASRSAIRTRCPGANAGVTGRPSAGAGPAPSSRPAPPR